MNKVTFRTIGLEMDMRKDSGAVSATLSTEAPVDMGGYLETLSHEPGAVNFERAKHGLPLLWQHNRDEIVGRVKNIRLENRRLRGDLTPGNSRRAQEIWADVNDGIIRDVSIGYRVNGNPSRDGSQQIVRDWTVYEVSLVSIGADADAGIGRKLNSTKNYNGGFMEDKNINNEDNNKNDQHDQHERFYKKDMYDERDRCAEIIALGAHHGLQDLATRAVQSGTSIESFRKQALNIIKENAQPGPVFRTAAQTDGLRSQDQAPVRLGLSEQEVNNFSFTRALQAMVSNRPADAGFEFEVSKAIEKRTGRKPHGIFVPFEILSHRAISKGDDGSYLIPIVHYNDSFIELLRKQTQVLRLGATVLTGEKGDISIPKQTAASEAHWLTEWSEIPFSDPSFASVTLTPKTLAARVAFSRKMIIQSVPDVEAIIRKDLSQVLALELDRVAINGSGTNPEPRGVLNTAGVNLIEIGANGGAPTWAHIVEMIAAIEGYNARGTGFLTSPKIKAKLSASFRNSTYGEQPIWEIGPDGEGRVGGYPALTSGNVPSNITKGTGTNLSAIIFGDWTNLMIGQWGILDLMTDPYTMASTGGVIVRAMLETDIGVRNTEAFSVIKDAATV